MKYLTFILILVPVFAFADPRINAQNDTCHIPLDPLDPNEELNLPGCGGVVIVSGGIAAGYAEKNGIIHLSVLPLVLQPADSTKQIINVDWKDLPNTDCKLKSAAGKKYESGRWWSRITLKRQKRTLPNGTEVLTKNVKWTARLRCIDGAKVVKPIPAP